MSKTNLPPLQSVSAPDSVNLFPKRGKWGALIFVSLVIAMFGSIAVSVNYPKDRLPAEPLSAELRRKFDKMPEGSNVLFYLNVASVRETNFWKTFLPDSIKNAMASDSGSSDKLSSLSKVAGFDFFRDADELCYSAINTIGVDEQVLAVVYGKFDSVKVKPILRLGAKDSLRSGSHLIYQLDSVNWISFAKSNELLLSKDSKTIQRYLEGNANFFAKDTLMQTLIDKLPYTSQIWLASGSTSWAIGSMQGITKKNEEISVAGNIGKLKYLTISARIDSGIKAETEWIYPSRTSAYFARGIVGFAVYVSEKFSQRQDEAIKKALSAIDVEQNLESLILRADFPRAMLDELKDRKMK
jgi:hypothetical protein